jgi:hypothetical protein
MLAVRNEGMHKEVLKMSRTLASVLVGVMVLAVAGVATAGIPDPDNSTVTLAPDAGMCTCPAGDGPPYQYITVEARRADLTPIQGIPSDSFFFTVTGGDVTITCVSVPPETNAAGLIDFEMVGDETIIALAPDPELEVECQIYTVVLNNSDSIPVNSFDIDGNGQVGLSDFGQFSAMYLTSDARGDFDWNGTVGLSDFGLFSAHYLHE